MAQPFTLEAPGGLTWVIDPPVDPCEDGYVREARVEIRADGLAAHTIANLDSATPQTLAEFFSQLDADWRGWDVQIAARHADPRTTMRYDRARQNLDRHPNYILAAYMASGT